MQKRLFLMLLVLFTGLLFGTRPPVAADDWQSKVEPQLLAALQSDRRATVEFLVVLAAQADLSAAAELPNKRVKGEWVYRQLTAHAVATQPSVMAALNEHGATLRPFWIVNAIHVRGTAAAVEAAARQAGVARVIGNWALPANLPSATPTTATARTIEWNISKINAPAVWADGITGAGVVVGGQDTGYDWQHPALINQYRGWDGNSASHDYNWHDAIVSGDGGICGLNAPAPCDDWGHGTHTAGTMVGSDLASDAPGWPDAAVNAIGVAPGAQWIGCRNMDVGDGTPARYIDCFEWMVAPTDLQGNNPQPALAPDVINNSWSCTVGEGCSQAQIDILLPAVAATRAAGIVVVASAGNSGSSCSSINTPPAIYDESFTVGAVTSSNTIASFSSRGPVSVDQSGRMKPDIVAPGVGVRSAILNASYGSSSGTSMAGPHIAGVVALIIDANPALRGQVDEIESIVRSSAQPLTTTQGCGGDTASAVPNNVFGFGLVDARAAVDLALAYPTAVTLQGQAAHGARGNSGTIALLVSGLTLALGGVHWQRQRRTLRSADNLNRHSPQ